MFQNQFIVLVIFFIPMLIHLEARQSFGEFLTAVNDTYAGGDQKLSIQTVRFSLDCNVQCTKTEFCNAVNFGNNTCELLKLSDDYEDRLQLKPEWTFSYRNNACLSKPCENEGSCNGRIGGYTCICAAGYEGVRCQDETDECLSIPCENGGSCEDFLAGYNCICADGYEGVHCQDETDECLSSPCENGGSCEDFLSGYICTCPDGYKGVHCQYLCHINSKRVSDFEDNRHVETYFLQHTCSSHNLLSLADCVSHCESNDHCAGYSQIANLCWICQRSNVITDLHISRDAFYIMVEICDASQVLERMLCHDKQPFVEMTSSGDHDHNHSVYGSCLDFDGIASEARAGSWTGNWAPYWIQADLESSRLITSVITQGRDDQDQWITEYKILYSTHTSVWITVQTNDNNDMIFSANFDRSTKISNSVDFTSRFVRLQVISFHDYPSLRWELLGYI